jgi:hypothetical protein
MLILFYNLSTANPTNNMITPPSLQKGDTVAILATARKTQMTT